VRLSAARSAGGARLGGAPPRFFARAFPAMAATCPRRGIPRFREKNSKKRLTQKINQSFESINHLIEKRAARRGAFEFKRKKLWQ